MIGWTIQWFMFIYAKFQVDAKRNRKTKSSCYRIGCTSGPAITYLLIWRFVFFFSMHKILFNLKLSMNIYSSLHHALAHSYFWLIKRHAGRGIRLLRPPQPSARPILWSLRLIQSSPLGFVARHRVRFAMLVLSVTLLLRVEDDIRSDAHNVWDPSVDGGATTTIGLSFYACTSLVWTSSNQIMLQSCIIILNM